MALPTGGTVQRPRPWHVKKNTIGNCADLTNSMRKKQNNTDPPPSAHSAKVNIRHKQPTMLIKTRHHCRTYMWKSVEFVLPRKRFPNSCLVLLVCPWDHKQVMVAIVAIWKHRKHIDSIARFAQKLPWCLFQSMQKRTDKNWRVLPSMYAMARDEGTKRQLTFLMELWQQRASAT